MLVLDSYIFLRLFSKGFITAKRLFLADYFSHFTNLFSNFAKIKVRYYRANDHSQIFLLQRNAFFCKIPIVSQTNLKIGGCSYKYFVLS